DRASALLDVPRHPIDWHAQRLIDERRAHARPRQIEAVAARRKTQREAVQRLLPLDREPAVGHDARRLVGRQGRPLIRHGKYGPPLVNDREKTVRRPFAPFWIYARAKDDREVEL